MRNIIILLLLLPSFPVQSQSDWVKLSTATGNIEVPNNGKQQTSAEMRFGDTTRTGVPFSKDPHVIGFKGRYLMYYSVPPYRDASNPVKGWGIGIAESSDLVSWKKIAEIATEGDYEKKGICAPCALVIGEKVNLFYQTYGNGRNDAICHAWSDDGIHFTRNATNPVFRPDGKWNCGRAIDAEVILFKGKYLLYYATRDSAYKIQMIGVAAAPGNSDFSRDDWKNISKNGPVLEPQLPWERECIEGASVIKKGRNLIMFYAGAYNNNPQQIGMAISKDGVSWKRISDQPFLANGKPGDWNSSESGHPHIFDNPDGPDYLFYQGNNDNGKTWFISNKKITWIKGLPSL
ncbi:MAG TPA: family 43 glycosylhydrolase [Bacteroidales bacterium]|nr:family 43 glycosylhydrolase [Bacteroidales bacterium]